MYSEFSPLLFLCGKVHRKALANKHAVCFLFIDMEWLVVCFNNGIGFVINSGNCRANLIILGKRCSKNPSVSSSDKIYV